MMVCGGVVELVIGELVMLEDGGNIDSCGADVSAGKQIYCHYNKKNSYLGSCLGHTPSAL